MTASSPVKRFQEFLQRRNINLDGVSRPTRTARSRPSKKKAAKRLAADGDKADDAIRAVCRDGRSAAQKTVDALERESIAYREVAVRSAPLSEEDIINVVAGEDMAKGSCASAALA